MPKTPAPRATKRVVRFSSGDIVRDRLRALESTHRRTRNPLDVRESCCIGDARKSADPQICAHISWSGCSIDTGFKRCNRAEENQIARAVSRSLEFDSGPSKGAVNPFRGKSDWLHGLAIASEVLFQVKHRGHKVDTAYDVVAREHPSRCDHRVRCPMTPKRHCID